MYIVKIVHSYIDIYTLELLNQISKYKEHFKEGESQLLETLTKEECTNYNFNTIFDYVVNLIAEINHQ